MYKIYSRKRFILKPFSTINSKKPSPQKTRQKKKLKKRVLPKVEWFIKEIFY